MRSTQDTLIKFQFQICKKNMQQKFWLIKAISYLVMDVLFQMCQESMSWKSMYATRILAD